MNNNNFFNILFCKSLIKNSILFAISIPVFCLMYHFSCYGIDLINQQKIKTITLLIIYSLTLISLILPCMFCFVILILLNTKILSILFKRYEKTLYYQTLFFMWSCVCFITHGMLSNLFQQNFKIINSDIYSLYFIVIFCTFVSVCNLYHEILSFKK